MSQTAPAPAPAAAAVEPWKPPSADQEWTVTNINEAPDWIDKNWAGFDRGPAIALPAGDLFGTGPYHTKFARTGDKVMFIAATGSKAARFEVIEKEPAPEDSTKKVPQASQASLEDMLKNGMLTPGELGPDAKAQVVSRSPGLKRMVEEDEGTPEPMAVGDVLKTA